VTHGTAELNYFMDAAAVFDSTQPRRQQQSLTAASMAILPSCYFNRFQ